MRFNKLLPGETIIQKDKLAKLEEDREFLLAFFGTFGIVTDLMAKAFREMSDPGSGAYARGQYDGLRRVHTEMVRRQAMRAKGQDDPIPF